MVDAHLVSDLIHSVKVKGFYDLTNQEVDTLIAEIERLRAALADIQREACALGPEWASDTAFNALQPASPKANGESE
jgi:hypothetical protein